MSYNQLDHTTRVMKCITYKWSKGWSINSTGQYYVHVLETIAKDLLKNEWVSEFCFYFVTFMNCRIVIMRTNNNVLIASYHNHDSLQK